MSFRARVARMLRTVSDSGARAVTIGDFVPSDAIGSRPASVVLWPNGAGPEYAALTSYMAGGAVVVAIGGGNTSATFVPPLTMSAGVATWTGPTDPNAGALVVQRPVSGSVRPRGRTDVGPGWVQTGELRYGNGQTGGSRITVPDGLDVPSITNGGTGLGGSPVDFPKGITLPPVNFSDLVLQNGWQQFDAPGTGYVSASVGIDATGRVELRGMVKHATPTTTGTIATVDPAWIPAGGAEIFPVMAGGGIARITLKEGTGAIELTSYVAGGSASYVSLSGVYWRPTSG